MVTSSLVVDPSMSTIVNAANNHGVGHHKRKANMISGPNGRYYFSSQVLYCLLLDIL